MTLFVVLILLTSELPDPGKVGTVTFAGGFGAFVGALVAHLRGHSSEQAAHLVRRGMLVGFGSGLIGWTVSFAIYRL